MTKLNFKTILLRALIGFYHGLAFIGRFLVFCGGTLFRGIGSIIQKLFLPIMLLCYRFMFAMRRRILFIVGPVRSKLLFFISHRHIIHVAILVIAVGTSAGSFGTRVARAEDLGTKSILYALVVSGADETLLFETPVESDVTPSEYLVDVVAVSPTPEIDFDYIDESYVSAITGARPLFVAPGGATSVATALRTNIEKYIVKGGDTISSIAETFQLSIATLLAANKLTVRSYIRPGDTLVILPMDGVLHTVKKGDALDKIARTYAAETRDIRAWNSALDEKGLVPGAEIFVPGGRLPISAPSRTTSSLARAFGGRPADFVAPPGGLINLWPTTVRRITQYFGWRHTGLDIAGPTGTPIYAADDGIVSYAGWSRGYGLNVVIDHGNGYKTRYAHSSKLLAVKGDVVKKGQVIELMGSTGRSTGPHVHFEVIQNGRFRNPLDFIR